VEIHRKPRQQALRPVRPLGKEEDAEKLWNDSAEVNGLFVKKVTTEVKRIEKERADKAKAEKEKVEKEKAASLPTPQSAPKLAAGPQLKPKKLLTPFEEILGDNFKNLSP
jgi:hypothetical protein